MVCLNNGDISPILSWVIPMALTAFATFVLVIGIYCIFKKQRKCKLKRLVLEYVYMVNLVIELGVALRAQFPHHTPYMRVVCVLTSVSSFIALICLIGDVVEQNMKRIALQGDRGGAPFLIYCCVCSKNIFMLIEGKDCTAIVSAVVQFSFRLAETLFRYLGSSILPRFIIENDFSIIPLILCLTTWVSRVLDNRLRRRNVVSVVIVGRAPDAPQPLVNVGAPIPDPPQAGAGAGNSEIPLEAPESALLHGIVHGNQAYLRKVFDLWSAQITLADGRALTLNSWTMRVSENDQPIGWQLPAVDFVALHFSLVDEDSVKAVNLANGDNPGWVQFLREHAPGVPIVLVGTDRGARDANADAHQGYFLTTAAGQRLALDIGAIAYEETNTADTQQLVGSLEQLMSDLL